MKRREIAFCLGLVVATAFVTKTVVSQDNDAAAAWAKLAAPGPFHEKLKPLEGTFEARSKVWTAPGATPVEATGTSTQKLVLGGRYVFQEYESKNGEAVLSAGMGFTGYDNLKKKFTGFWVDTFSTSVLTSTGTCDESGKVLTFNSEFEAGGQTTKFRAVVTIESEKKNTYELYQTGADGKEWKKVEVVYTKK